MTRLLLGILLFVAAVVVLKMYGKKSLPARFEGDKDGVNPARGFAIAGAVVLILLGIVSILSTSFTTIPADSTGHLIKVDACVKSA